MSPDIAYIGRHADGRQGRGGADRVIVTHGAAMVLDGASAFGASSVSPAAYADRLGAELASAITASPTGPLTKILATAIDATANALDLRYDLGPSSTAAIARVNGADADMLVLGDSYIAYRSAATTVVLTDDRMDQLDLPQSRRYLVDATGQLIGVGERNSARPVPGDIDDADAAVTEHAASYRALRKFFEACHLMAPSPLRAESRCLDHSGQHRQTMSNPCKLVPPQALSLPTAIVSSTST